MPVRVDGTAVAVHHIELRWDRIPGVPAGPVNADDVRAEIAEHHRRERPRTDARELDHS